MRKKTSVPVQPARLAKVRPAVLELYKRSMVKINQDELFGDIAIDYIEGSGDLRLEGDDALTSVGEE